MLPGIVHPLRRPCQRPDANAVIAELDRAVLVEMGGEIGNRPQRGDANTVAGEPGGRRTPIAMPAKSTFGL
jgi:hypothetical protein